MACRPNARTATGPRSQRVEAENGLENPKDLCRGNALRAGTARGPILRTDATVIIAHGARSHGWRGDAISARYGVLNMR